MAAAPQTGTGSAGTNVNVSHGASVWAILAAGLILVALADYAPHLVNGVLVLILSGVVLKNSDVWIPWIQGISGSFGGL